MERIELACPLCAGRIEVQASRKAATMNCPRCGRPVTIPATPPPGPSSQEFETSAESLPAIATGSTGAQPPSEYVSKRGGSPPGEVPEPMPAASHQRSDKIHFDQLDPKRREVFRRRMNMVFAVTGILALALILAILLHFGS